MTSGGIELVGKIMWVGEEGEENNGDAEPGDKEGRGINIEQDFIDIKDVKNEEKAAENCVFCCRSKRIIRN